MAKKVLVITTSLRGNSNSDALAEAFAEGARAAGNEVELISLKKKRIAFCMGCLTCISRGRCMIDDDANMFAEKIRTADVVAYATPIYYYEMSGQMKTLLDRVNSLYTSDYAFRDIYLLSTAAEDEPDVDERAVHGLEGWIACFEKARLAGHVAAGGVDGPGTIANHPALEKARALGGSIQ